MISFFAPLLSLLIGFASPSMPAGTSFDEVQALVDKLLAEQDEVDPEVIRDLAKLQTKPALEGLLSGYEEMGSIFMRRALLRAIAGFDGIAELEHQAAAKLRDVATQSSEQKLRIIAVGILASCRSTGPSYLASLVNSGADAEVREVALRYHVISGGAADLEWYYELYSGQIHAEEAAGDGPGGQRPKKAERIKAAKQREKEGPKQKIHRLQVLREIAFERLLSTLTLEELVRSLSDGNAEIRKRGLSELENRGYEKALEVAERIYANPRESGENRLVAAGIMKKILGEELIPKFLKDATRADESEQVVMGLAELLNSYRSPDVEKASLKLVGKGRGLELRFSLRLAAAIDDPKVDKALLKVIRGKDEEAAIEAIRILAQRENTEAIEPLTKLVEKSKSNPIVAAALTAIGSLNGMDTAWVEQLIRYSQDPDLILRNAAILSMANFQDPRVHEAILAALAHDNWSTRLVAAEAIQTLNLKAGVGAMALRMQHESGRPAHELAKILFDMTGKPYGLNGRSWEKWWQDEQDQFEIISSSEREKNYREREESLLREITKSTRKQPIEKPKESVFFGIQIKSKSVVFVIDVSGSMEEATQGDVAGVRGPSRMNVAKEELKNAVASLAADSFFNIITFSSDVRPWQPQLVGYSEETRSDAVEHAAELRSGGGTNLYGAIERAFEDEQVDSIYILSDGEPSTGSVVEPFTILRIVKEWNTSRKIEINCIAIGASLDILEALAEATGGSYVRIP